MTRMLSRICCRVFGPPKGPAPAPAGQGNGTKAGMPAGIRDMIYGLFDDSHFAATFLVWSGVTFLLGVTWLYRYLVHDPDLDPASGAAFPVLAFCLCVIVLVRFYVIWRRNHDR